VQQDAYQGMKVNVVGMGATGLSLARFLNANGALVSVFDSKANAAGLDALRAELPQIAFAQIDLQRDALPASDLIAISPGVPRTSVALVAAINRGVEVVGDIELFARLNKPNRKIYAITGSNGKTTTASITGAIASIADAETCIAGNIGLPVLDAIREKPSARTWVIEISSFQLESTRSLQCESATVLNVTANHLDRYPSFFAYAATKERIYANAKRQVINHDDMWSSAMRRVDRISTSFGGSKAPTDSDYGIRADAAQTFIQRGAADLIDCSELKLRGSHNTMNVMAALALTESLDVPLERVREMLRAFAGVAHRYEWLGQVAGIDVINDSKATTVVSTRAALDGNTAPTWLIAGGDGKGQSFESLAAATTHCRAVHVIGKDATAICAALDSRGVVNQRFASLEDATVAALEQGKAGDTLLLSPACASWDMFRNYEHRAQVFTATVARWAQLKGLVLSKERGHA
jgi:UDP-N-acetylmuramoylalanine--D-glutamate ligase